MGIPDLVSPDPELPEQHLLRGGDRLQDYASAFLRGEITAEQYSQMTFAEINRRLPLDPLRLLGDEREAAVEVVASPPPVIHDDPLSASLRLDDDRSIVLARAFVSGRICGADFLRLVRDC